MAPVTLNKNLPVIQKNSINLPTWLKRVPFDPNYMKGKTLEQVSQGLSVIDRPPNEIFRLPANVVN